jgi:hypothetical protein
MRPQLPNARQSWYNEYEAHEADMQGHEADVQGHAAERCGLRQVPPVTKVGMLPDLLLADQLKLSAAAAAAQLCQLPLSGGELVGHL